MITFDDLWRKLSDKKYREHYAMSLLKRSIAFQIKTLRKRHCSSQAELAQAAGITQGVVSRAEDPDYGNLTFNTVGRIASGLDVAFIGRFVPWTELARFSQNLSEEEFTNLLTFEEENAGLSPLSRLGSANTASPDIDVFSKRPPRSETDCGSRRQSNYQDEQCTSGPGIFDAEVRGGAAQGAAAGGD
jgi:transcriptional regulator with XRE-family HTH domain